MFSKVHTTIHIVAEGYYSVTLRRKVMAEFILKMAQFTPDYGTYFKFTTNFLNLP